MPKREKECCKKCGRNVGEEKLSNKKLCYDCARESMLRFFDDMWAISHPGARTGRR